MVLACHKVVDGHRDGVGFAVQHARTYENARWSLLVVDEIGFLPVGSPMELAPREQAGRGKPSLLSFP